MSKPTFGRVFLDRVDQIVKDAQATGINLTTVCEKAGISRATPDRWRRKLPKTIATVEKMEKVVAEHGAATSSPGEATDK